MLIEKKAITATEENKVSELLKVISEIDEMIYNLKEEKEGLYNDLLNIKLAPFKLGDTALVEIPSGRSKKWQKCLLESEDGILYVRPYKADGCLSSRHFILYPSPFTNSYEELLKEVK